MLAALLSLAAIGAGDIQADRSMSEKAPVVIVNPSWLEAPQPSYDDYPPFAWMIGVNARVDVECMSNAQGVVKDCRVTRETPYGLGFGAAALAIVPRGRLSPRSVDGVPTASAIALSLPFSTNPRVRTPPKAWREPEPSPAHLAAADAYVSSVGDWPVLSFAPVVQSLAEDRREIVLRWLTDVLPNAEQSRKIFVRALARTVPQTTLNRWASGTFDEKDFQLFADIQLAVDDQFDLNAAEIELRRRYCSRYDCDVPLDR